MDDRELLEAAAKAAGIFLTPEQFALECTSPWEDGMGPYYDEQSGMLGYRTWYGSSGEIGGWEKFSWNPLEDDADAFRLAVKLNLHVEIDAESAGVITIEWDFDESGTARRSVEQDAPVGGDDYAATRRAIVRAAAALTSQEPR